MKPYKELHAEFVEKMEAVLAELKAGEPISQAALARLIILFDESSLELRIANLKRTCDMSTELAALSELRKRYYADKLAKRLSSPAHQP